MIYRLQVYSFVQRKWVNVAHVAPSSRPHCYQDVMLPEWERLVGTARQGSSRQAPIGYRILQDEVEVCFWANWVDK
jgi:hypothetical protein